MNVAKVTNTAMLERMRAVARLSLRTKGPRCRVCSLPKSVLSAIEQLRGEGLPYTSIAVALKGDGHLVNSFSLSRHFRGHDRT